MSEQPGPDVKVPDPLKFSQDMAEIAERSQKLVGQWLEQQVVENNAGPVDPLNVGRAFFEMTAKMMSDPSKMMQAQAALWQDYMRLWQSTAQKMMGGTGGDVAEPERGDRRFKDPMWDDNGLFDYIKQSYLLSARWMHQTVTEVEGLDDKTAKKVDFYTRQFVDAMAPSNFLMTNPEVLKATVESGGENLLSGLKNLLSDMERGKGKLRISMTDEGAFQLGKNVAVTPGKVVFQNDLMQLIQYEPTTEQQFEIPLLIIPPWINKFYILDLREKNSFVRWATAQGFTVFVISWVNPDSRLAQKRFDDYLVEGPLAALDAMEQATGVVGANVIGYCLGGTLLSATLAHMAARKDKRFKAATFFVTMTDFAEAGELGVFIDEAQLQFLEKRMEEQGYLEGSDMATTFNMLRANDLIWSFVVNNYLLGKDPFPFDLLYWNSDSTRMPAAMHSYYLRNMYQKNLLREPDALTIAGVPIDLGKITLPCCFVSTREDHIAPWKSTYQGTQLVGGKAKFILAGSGHIAGIVNPPPGKYPHWTNTKNPPTADDWLETATQHEGSWWPTWLEWLRPASGKMVPARVPGDHQLEVIEDAPGSYVAVKAQD
ncbi:MAG: class I poly(R)-hydroxyalkanoic acid synthase [Rhodospirillales bacterium]